MDKDLTIRVRARWVRIAVLVAVVALVAFPAGVMASHRFTDVPDTNIFQGDISWLADADVTRGCNPPDNTEFCPKDNVTREQMAAFMNRLANNQVVDAGMLEGLAANQLVRSSHAELGAVIDDYTPTSAFDTIFSTTAEAPVPGILVVLAHYNAEWDISSAADSGRRIQSRLTVNGETFGIQPFSEFEQVGPIDQDGKVVSIAAGVPVTAGTHTLNIDIRDSSGAAMLFIQNASITTVFVPFGDAGNQGVLGMVSSTQGGDGNN